MPDLTAGSTHPSGFHIDARTELPELNLVLWQLHHQKTGARMVHLENDDPNNLFAATFRTPPQDSTGVAHILEHTVLCGSRHYPVRDPFFSMLKRSLNTFMNAMTSSDWTSYPFASQNHKDFYNLFDIYLDAVFSPLLREADFRQEGHRLEPLDLDHPEGELQFQGVVYNEMKGAMASPSSLLSRRLAGALYPETTYRHNSGGEPAEIPGLTWHQLREFHRRYYHPSNCWLYSYGNLPLSGHLDKLGPVLDAFDAAPIDSSVPPEHRRQQPFRVEERFPLGRGENPAGKSMVQLAWLTCDIVDQYQRLALNLLATLLLGNPAAPLYRALIESRLGANLAPGCGYHDENRTTYFAAGLQGTDPQQADAIEELILTTLREVADQGLPRERIEAALHRLEFSNREVSGDSYPYPLLLLMRMLGPWLHADDPISPLKIEGHLDRLRQELQEPGALGRLIREQLLDNPHRLRLTLQPDTTLQQQEAARVKQQLAELREGFDAAGLQRLADQARELKAAQDAEEDLSCLPTLGRSDIPTEELPVPAEPHPEDGMPLYLFRQPTNGIGYLTAHLQTAELAPGLRPRLPLFGALLSQIGAAGYSYLQMAERIEAATGGISAGCEVLEDPADAGLFQGHLVLKGKALHRNLPLLSEILTDICSAPDFTDLQRIQTVLNQLRTSLENSVPGSGHSYAARAASATLSASCARRELWSGLSLLQQIKQLAAKPAEELEELAGELRQLAGELFQRGRFACAMAGDADDAEALLDPLRSFWGALPQGSARDFSAGRESFQPSPQLLGFAASVPVAYVTRAFATVNYRHPDAAPLAVLAKLLRAGYLHREIREKGGAYGGMAGFNPESGIFTMLSYRDPQILRTLQVYDAAAGWAAAGSFTSQAVDEAVLAVFSDLDRPLSPAGRAAREFANLLQPLDLESRQQFRRQVLATDRDTLVRVAETYLVQGRSRASSAILAGSEALQQANHELGGEMRITEL